MRGEDEGENRARMGEKGMKMRKRQEDSLGEDFMAKRAQLIRTRVYTRTRALIFLFSISLFLLVMFIST